jgi:MHS family proline/betaine transporter-like MFS transporter
MIRLAAMLMLAAYPAFALLTAFPSGAMLAGTMLLLTALRAGYSAPVYTLLGELFPSETRGLGLSLSYTLGVVIFGGFAPYLLTWLIRVTGDPAVPGYYLAACSAITLGALLYIKARVKLQD